MFKLEVNESVLEFCYGYDEFSNPGIMHCIQIFLKPLLYNNIIKDYFCFWKGCLFQMKKNSYDNNI